MKWETINPKKIKKYRFSIVLDHQRYNKLQLLMNVLKTKQKAKAINFLLDFIDLQKELEEIIKEKK